MSLIKYNRVFPTFLGSFLDGEESPSSLMNWSNWPELSSSQGLELYETDNEVIAKAAVPGVPEEKVEVTVEGNILSIKADHEETKEEKDKKKVVYKSTRQTSFNYSTSLPRMVDGSRAVAEVENGVVKVTIPKAEEEKPKKILVKKK
jgi:HSP20 family protein